LPGETIDVVFVHGILSSGKAWDQFIRVLGKDKDLAPFIRAHRFEYDSPKVKWRPGECIPEIDTVADHLDTYLSNSHADARSIILVTHSQGGLVAQRFLVRVLSQSRGHELARIRHIAMYACPNNGSQFLLPLRNWLGSIWLHAQERELRPLHRQITETQRAVLRDVVNARGCTASQCHIPISLYGGEQDNIVRAHVATGAFPKPEVVPGNHSTIIQPAGLEALSYTVLKQRLLKISRDVQGEVTAEDVDGVAAERQLWVSVDPPPGSREGQVQGRDELIAEVMSDSRSRVHILTGLPGAGKTRVALEIAARFQRPGHRVWWVSLTRINGCMKVIASDLGIPESRVEAAWRGACSPTDLIWEALERYPGQWLLVFDNADVPSQLASSSGDVTDGTGWLRAPETRTGTVIVTSREGNPAAWGTWCHVRKVEPLAQDDGAAMLMEGIGGGGGTFDQARELSRELGGLPLALRAAARYVNSARDNKEVWTGDAGITDLDRYLQAVRQRFGSPAGGSGDLSEALGLQIVQQVFELSLDLLRRRGLPEAAPMLRLLACMNIAAIPYHVLLRDDALRGSALLAGCDSVRRPLVLRGLADLALVDLSIMEGIFDRDLAHVLSLHPVVHGIFRDDKEVQAQRGEYYRILVRMLLAATAGFDPDYAESWETWSVLVPHTVEVCRATLLGSPPLQAPRVIPDALELLRITTRYLIVAGIIHLAEELVAPVIENCVTLGFEADSRQILGLRHEQGRLAIERGALGEAERELAEVVAVRTRVLGEKNPDTLASRHKLAKAILLQGRLEAAERQLASIVEDEKHVRGYDHSDTLVVRHSLARAIFRQGRYARGEEMLREILAKRCEIWSPTTPETLSVRESLAYCLIRQGKPREGETVARDALGEVADRRDSPRAMELRYTLSLALLYQGRVTEARSELEGLVADREQVLGRGHPETRKARGLLGRAIRLSDASGEHNP
jgi:pimeloyl-ACP methyl ester carboxylesterase